MRCTIDRRRRHRVDDVVDNGLLLDAIDPLYEHFHSDALNALVRSNGGLTADGDVTVSFRFGVYRGTVASDGGVIVRAHTADA